VQPDPDNVGDYLISARSFDEYRAMFALAGSDLSGAVLDCPGGGSSFTACANQAGGSAIAADPAYARPRHSLPALVMAEVERGSAHTAAGADRYCTGSRAVRCGCSRCLSRAGGPFRRLEMRIFDFWVHERDISTPLGWPSDDAGPRAEIALGQVEASIGYIVGKKIGLPHGASIVFHLTGPVTRDLAAVVDGRARAVDHVEHPDVELTTDTVTFIQLAAGRIDPQRQIDAGLVTWTGDAQLGEHAARNLRFTI
jgi:hypothetical protein